MQHGSIDDDDFTDGFSEEHLDRLVLEFMLNNGAWPWTLDELGCELGHNRNAADAVCRLAGAGMVHRFGPFVFPTRTARRANELQDGTV